MGDGGLNVFAACSPKDLSVRHSVTPGDPQVALKAADMKLLQRLHMATVGDPGFTAVEKGSDTNGLIDRYFRVSPESSEGSRCLLDPVLDLTVNTIVFTEYASQVSERWYDRQFFISNSEDGWCGWDVSTPLANHLWFVDVDGQPHPAVCLHCCIKDSLEIFWSVSHKSTVICILQLKDPHSVQLGGSLQPPNIENVAI